MNNKDKFVGFKKTEGRRFMKDENGLIYEITDHFQKEQDQKPTIEKTSPEEMIKLPVDTLLDMYNDYMTLFHMFNDTIYQARAKVVYAYLKSKTQAEGGEIA